MTCPKWHPMPFIVCSALHRELGCYLGLSLTLSRVWGSDVVVEGRPLREKSLSFSLSARLYHCSLSLILIIRYLLNKIIDEMYNHAPPANLQALDGFLLRKNVTIYIQPFH